MDLAELDQIKRLAVISMFSDDDLMDRLVLKGGNAIDLVYRISGRASIDVDFSMQTQFAKDELAGIQRRVEKALSDTFRLAGITVFDVHFAERPEIQDSRHDDWWGGYRIEFKSTPTSLYENEENIDLLRTTATVVGPRNRRKFIIEISKFEYCEGKIPTELGGYTVYVYSTEMIVLEKIRAICQQFPEYRSMLGSHPPAPRARDFFDIYIILQEYPIDFSQQRIHDLLECIFQAKRIPLSYIARIHETREFHRQDFASVADTIRPGVPLEGFDFYFDYVLSELGPLRV